MFFLNKSLPKSHNVPLLFPYNNVLLKPTEKAGVVMHPSFHTTMFFLNEVIEKVEQALVKKVSIQQCSS